MVPGRILTFAEHLRHHRRVAALTQEQLAERAELSLRAVSDLERGVKRHPHQETVQRLAQGLGLAPSERAAFERAARSGGSPALGAGESLPAPSLSPPRHNLPFPTTSFVGREQDLAQGCALLRTSGVRLMTVIAPGGSGKTRLALEIAAALLPHFADGVCVVDLAPLRETALVAAQIARTLGVQEDPTQPVTVTLQTYLRDRQLLLVLDNFEHLLDAAPLVVVLLAHAERLKVLATSRAALQVRGEQRFPLAPLSLPTQAMSVLPAGSPMSAAVQLFTERAQAVRPDFVLTAQNGAAVAEIVRRLDGLPLLIELAAARIAGLTPQALLGRLAHRLDLLTDGLRDLPERQQTLRTTLEWSYQLLTAVEQRLFRSLAVFAGGCSLPATAAVIGIGTSAAVLRQLDVLVHQSLVQVAAGGNGEPRFTMLETIQEYAREQLQAQDDSTAIHQQHATFFLSLVETEPDMSQAWIEQIEIEYDNVRAALDWAVTGAAVEIAVALVARLGSFWYFRGQYDEGLRWLPRVLDQSQGRPWHSRAVALMRASQLAYSVGQYHRAEVWSQESAALFRALGDPAGTAWALTGVISGALERGAYAHATAAAQEALDLRRALGEPAAVANSLLWLGEIARVQEATVQAVTWCTQALRICRAHPDLADPSTLPATLRHLGLAVGQQGDQTRADSLLREGLRESQARGLTEGLPQCLVGLAAIAVDTPHADAALRAARLLGAVQTAQRLTGGHLGAADSRAHDRVLRAVRAQLTDPAWAVAWAAGQA